MDAKKIEAKEVVSASKKLNRKDAVALIKGANKVIVAKGRKVQSFPGGKASKEIVDALLGPTGNLRAPHDARRENVAGRLRRKLLRGRSGIASRHLMSRNSRAARLLRIPNPASA